MENKLVSNILESIEIGKNLKLNIFKTYNEDAKMYIPKYEDDILADLEKQTKSQYREVRKILYGYHVRLYRPFNLVIDIGSDATERTADFGSVTGCFGIRFYNPIYANRINFINTNKERINLCEMYKLHKMSCEQTIYDDLGGGVIARPLVDPRNHMEAFENLIIGIKPNADGSIGYVSIVD